MPKPTAALRASISLFILAAGAAFPCLAADRIDWAFKGSILAILEDNGNEGDPSPVMPSPGFDLSIPVLPLVAFEPSLDFYGTYYGYSDKLERAVPYAIENRSAQVVGIVLGTPIAFRWRLRNDLTMRAFAGPAFDFRICYLADGLKLADKEDARAQTDKILGYFWGAGRWFVPTAGVSVDLPSFPGLLVGLEARTWFPMYRLWSGEDLPIIEGLRFAFGVRLSFR